MSKDASGKEPITFENITTLDGIKIERVEVPQDIDTSKEGILQKIFKGMSSASDQPSIDDEEASYAADLSLKDVKQLVEGVASNGNGMAILKAVAKSPNGRIFISEIMAVTGISEYRRASGVISGLTRRTRTITSNPDALLLEWNWDEGITEEVEQGGYFCVSEASHKSLRDFFSIT